MRAKKNENKDKLETALKLLEKNYFRLRKIVSFYVVKKIMKKYMIILRKEYAPEAGVSGKKKMKIFFSKFFLINQTQSTIHKIIFNDQEITDHNKIKK